VLLWEQGIVYALSIALGLAAGLLLSILVLPVLVIANSITDLNHFDPTKLDIPPVHAVLPVPLLGAALGVLVILCVISIVLMTAIASRASISQALRLNED
jgi:ABC-type antimicrobial peptide transport system permease subunit